jgi:hypothetical protein
MGTLMAIWKIGRAALPQHGRAIPLAGCLAIVAAPLFAGLSLEHGPEMLQTFAVACVYLIGWTTGNKVGLHPCKTIPLLSVTALGIGSFSSLVDLLAGPRPLLVSYLGAGFEEISHTLSLPGVAALITFMVGVGAVRLAGRVRRERKVEPLDCLAAAAGIHLAGVLFVLASSIHSGEAAALTALPSLAILVMWMLAQGRPRVEILLVVLLLGGQWLTVLQCTHP